MTKKLTVIQMLPALEGGGVERGTLELGKYLSDQGHRSIVISAGGRMTDQLIEEGSEHLELPVGKKSLLTLRYVSKVKDILQTIKPDILHLRSRLPAWIGYLAWKKLPKDVRPKLITTVHGPYSIGRYSSVMVRGQGVIAVSNMIRDYILDNYGFVDPEAIRVIYRGVDASQYKYGFKPSKAWTVEWYLKYPQMKGKKLLTLPGRVTRLKGHEDFIHVIASLTKSDQSIHGVIVGGVHPNKKRYAEEIKHLIDSLNLQEHITFVGHRSDLKDVLSLSTVVFSLSKIPESFGRTTIESLSIGIPVIGYCHGGVKEQLEQIFPEGLVEIGSIDAAATKIQSWLPNPPVPARNTTFTLEAMCAKTVGVYRELVGSGNGSPIT